MARQKAMTAWGDRYKPQFPPKVLADSFSILRKATGITHEEVAYHLDVPLSSVQKFEESGKSGAITPVLKSLPFLFDKRSDLLGCRTVADMVDVAERLPALAGGAVRGLREHLGITQQQLADKLGDGVRQADIHDFEHGKKISKIWNNASSVAAALGCHSLMEVVEKANTLSQEQNYLALGRALYRLRKKTNMSLSEIGGRLGGWSSSMLLEKFERGEAVLSPSAVKKLPDLFGFNTISDFIEAGTRGKPASEFYLERRYDPDHPPPGKQNPGPGNSR
jgi:transcriptional regulator with XRE-family HTH domain